MIGMDKENAYTNTLTEIILILKLGFPKIPFILHFQFYTALELLLKNLLKSFSLNQIKNPLNSGHPA